MALDDRFRVTLEQMGEAIVRARLRSDYWGANAPDVHEWLAEREVAREQRMLGASERAVTWARYAALAGIVAVMLGVVSILIAVLR